LRECGVVFDRPVSKRRRFCDDCLQTVKAEQVQALSNAGPAALRELRRQGRDPNHRPEVRAKIGRSQSERRLRDLAWDAAHPGGADPTVFEEIAPMLRSLPLRVIAEASGLSIRAASYVRAGKPPHPRHWEGLRGLASR
jgi:hypothetical protein